MVVRSETRRVESGECGSLMGRRRSAEGWSCSRSYDGQGADRIRRTAHRTTTNRHRVVPPPSEDDAYFYQQYDVGRGGGGGSGSARGGAPPIGDNVPERGGGVPGLRGLGPSFLSRDVDGRVLRIDSFSKARVACRVSCGGVLRSFSFSCSCSCTFSFFFSCAFLVSCATSRRRERARARTRAPTHRAATRRAPSSPSLVPLVRARTPDRRRAAPTPPPRTRLVSARLVRPLRFRPRCSHRASGSAG